MELAKLIVNALATGALGTAAWAVFDELVKHWPALAGWTTLGKRVVVGALCLLLVAPVFCAAVAMLWLPQPMDWRGWVSEIGGYTMVAYVASQALHAVERDRAE